MQDSGGYYEDPRGYDPGPPRRSWPRPGPARGRGGNRQQSDLVDVTGLFSNTSRSSGEKYLGGKYSGEGMHIPNGTRFMVFRAKKTGDRMPSHRLVLVFPDGGDAQGGRRDEGYGQQRDDYLDP